ncbi:MAG: sugar nucleotide-binding protein [Deltaproteobacteria bacterium]|nr:sugar nucleotide-binding protein [Deltaproteobacteria bacterium]
MKSEETGKYIRTRIYQLNVIHKKFADSLADSKIAGIYHWTDSGVASWYDFAVAIYEEATILGILTRPVNIRPLRTEEYPTIAHRPAYSVLEKSSMLAALGYFPPHWRTQLRSMLKEILGRAGPE